MTHPHSHHPGDCERFGSQLEDWLAKQLDAATCLEMESHRAACAKCSVAFNRRSSVLETLQFAKSMQIKAPAELDARAAKFGDSEEFIRLMFRHLEPVAAPAELDARVAASQKSPASPPVFVVLKQKRATRRIVYAAAASLVVTVGATWMYFANARHAGDENYKFTFVQIPRDKMPPALRAQVLPLSGLPLKDLK